METFKCRVSVDRLVPLDGKRWGDLVEGATKDGDYVEVTLRVIPFEPLRDSPGKELYFHTLGTGRTPALERRWSEESELERSGYERRAEAVLAFERSR